MENAEDNKIIGLDGYELNPKVEVKNINSFRSELKKRSFEVERQTKVLDARGAAGDC